MVSAVDGHGPIVIPDPPLESGSVWRCEPLYILEI